MAYKSTVARKRHEEFLQTQNECHLCGHEVDTYMEYLPGARFAVEKAQCGNCMTFIRVKNHSIQ